MCSGLFLSGCAYVMVSCIDSAKGLLSAVDSLPQLLERKKLLEVHTNILQAIFGSIAAREVPGRLTLGGK